MPDERFGTPTMTMHIGNTNAGQMGFAAVALQNEAGRLQRMGNREAALAKFREALALKVQASGEHSIACGITLDSMGVCLIEMGRLPEAEDVLRQACAIRNDLDKGLVRPISVRVG